jgi:hypothetical protein
MAYKADVAQLVEQLIRNQQVCGSIPHVGSNHSITCAKYPFYIKGLNTPFSLRANAWKITQRGPEFKLPRESIQG